LGSLGGMLLGDLVWGLAKIGHAMYEIRLRHVMLYNTRLLCGGLYLVWRVSVDSARYRRLLIWECNAWFECVVIR